MTTKECCNQFTPFPQSDNAFAQAGLLMHELLEGYANSKFYEFELAELHEQYFDKYVQERFPYNAHASLYDGYYDGGLTYLNDFDGFGDYKILHAEVDEYVRLGDHNLHLVIDLVLEDADGNIIIEDHKSKASFKNKQEQKERARQLYLYSLFIMEKYGKFPTELVFNMFRKQKIVRIPFVQDDLTEACDWALGVVNKIQRTTEYPANPASEFFCKEICSFKDSCTHIGGE